MFKKTVTYIDFLGTTRTEDLYFNLTKSELNDMQMSVDGGLQAKLDRMIKGANNKEIYKAFTEIVAAAYGELSPDGKYHLKEDERGNKLVDKFKRSLAYDALMDEICKDETTIAKFCNEIIPKELREGNKNENDNNGGPQDFKGHSHHQPVNFNK